MAKKDHLNLFIPTTPNPTSGFYFMVDESEVKSLDMPVEVAFKIIVSGGTLSTQEIEAQEAET